MNDALVTNYLAWFSGVVVFVLWYIYSGYLLLLKLLVSVQGAHQHEINSALFKVTVLLTVHNEERIIIERINNLLNQDYPGDLLEVIVASDGSTDATNYLVESYRDPRVRLFVSEGGHGKTATQNDAIKEATGDLVMFTDAGSRFELDFISKIAAVFNHPSIGAADGHLLFSSQAGNQLANSQGYYWRYELALRELESRLGILAVASGACLVVRRELVLEMEPSVGEDCIVPLDVIAQGYKLTHVRDAIAYDVMENTSESEFRTRVRMTLRNWQGTWSRAQLLNPYFYPGYAFALWSHKVLRWLSPFFLIALTLCLTIGTLMGNTAMQVGLNLLAYIYGIALLGLSAERWGWRIPVVATIYSFMLANTGFMIGVSKALLGQRIHKYR